MEKYRVAFIGCGGISRAHVNGYKSCERTAIVAGFDTNPAQLEKWGKDTGVTNLYSDCDEMLKKEKPDIVSICTYVNSHCELTVKCSQSGIKAILCEKPMALNMEEANRMVDECDKHGVKLAIGHQRRHSAQHQFTKRLIDGVEIGKLIALWGSSPSDLMDWGTHVVDMMVWYAGDVEWVMGQVDMTPIKRHPRGYLNVTPIMGYIRFKSGASGIIETDIQGRLFPQPRIHIRGEKGEIEVMMDGGLKYCSWDRLNWTSPNLVFKDAFYLEVENLCDCIEQNKAPLDSGKEAIKTQEVLMAIAESARLKGKVLLPLSQMTAPLDLIAQNGELEKS